MTGSDAPETSAEINPVADALYEPEDVNRGAQPSPAEGCQLPGDGGRHDPFAPLRFRDYRLYSAGALLIALGSQMFSVCVLWEVYARTHSAWMLGLVGLAQAVPVIAFALPAGEVADRFDRRYVILITQLAILFCWYFFAIMSRLHSSLTCYFVAICIEASVQAFNNPARTALLPQVVPEEHLASAITLNSSRWQVAATVGPAIGGFAIAAFHGSAPVYALTAALALGSFLLSWPMRPRAVARPHATENAWHRLVAGIGFIRGQSLFLATITMDLFAVFLGGAITLLPLFADRYLHVGPAGLGWLRAAPAAGALCMSVWLSIRPPMRNAGSSLLWAVAGFGAAIMVFGLSRNFWLSLAMLFLTGAFDNVSVIVRSTLMQILTPARMRGRVSAVNSVFIGSSNELGGFESGLAAHLFGPVAAVVGGGIGTILVVLAVTAIWPQVATLRSLHNMRPQDT